MSAELLDANICTAAIDEAMETIARRSGQNIVCDRTVDDSVTVTMTLRNISWRDAVDLIADQTRCEIKTMGHAYMVSDEPKVTIHNE